MSMVHFLPGGRVVEVGVGTTILEAARSAGVLIEAPCNGAGQCGKCAVLVPVDELLHLVLHEPATPLDGKTARVLACHADVTGDVTVTVPVRGEKGLVAIDAGLSRFVPLLPHITTQFHPERSMTTVWAGDFALAEESGDTRLSLFGIVFDIGTTTLVGALIDLNSGTEVATASALNPQSLHAQDVLSRIRFASNPDGLAQLQSELMAVLNRMTTEVCGEAGIAPSRIFEAIFSGNTCMVHLAVGVDPEPLGKIPFTPTIRGGNHLPATDISLQIAPNGIVYLPEIISAYVGADISVGILAADLAALSGVSLFIDIGTNGELVVAVDGLLTASATAAGPAFEGMNISSGMRAASGAIERVSLNGDGTLEIGVISAAEPRGICGSGLMDLVALLLQQGLIGPSGRFTVPAAALSTLVERLEGEGAGRAFRVSPGVTLTQKDIRQVQLAKGAIRAGIELLLESAAVSPSKLDRVLIAGSFGYHLSEESLLTLGLLPPEAVGKVSFLGNTSRSGGEMLLVNRTLRAELASVVSRVTTVELAANPCFERAFVEAMKF